MCNRCETIEVERKTVVWKKYEVPACLVLSSFEKNEEYSMDLVGEVDLEEYETDEFNWEGHTYEDEWWYNEEQLNFVDSLKDILSCPDVMSDAEKLQAALKMLEDYSENKTNK